MDCRRTGGLGGVPKTKGVACVCCNANGLLPMDGAWRPIGSGRMLMGDSHRAVSGVGDAPKSMPVDEKEETLTCMGWACGANAAVVGCGKYS